MTPSSDSSQSEFWDRRFASGRTPWDFHGVPATLKSFLKTPSAGRVLIPGCGTAYQIRVFRDAGWEVTAIDFPNGNDRAANNSNHRIEPGPAYGLVRDTSGILLDRTPESSDLPDEIRRAIESDGDSLVTDLHVWQVGAGKFAAIVCIVAHDPKPVEIYRALFHEHEELVHVTVEIEHCHNHEDSRVSA